MPEDHTRLPDFQVIQTPQTHVETRVGYCSLGVDRLSAPILSIFTIIDIGHFQNRFADIFYFFIMQTNILFTGDIIYWWINSTGEIITFLNALFGSMQPVWAQHCESEAISQSLRAISAHRSSDM